MGSCVLSPVRSSVDLHTSAVQDPTKQVGKSRHLTSAGDLFSSTQINPHGTTCEARGRLLEMSRRGDSFSEETRKTEALALEGRMQADRFGTSTQTALHKGEVSVLRDKQASQNLQNLSFQAPNFQSSANKYSTDFSQLFATASKAVIHSPFTLSERASFEQHMQQGIKPGVDKIRALQVAATGGAPKAEVDCHLRRAQVADGQFHDLVKEHQRKGLEMAVEKASATARLQTAHVDAPTFTPPAQPKPFQLSDIFSYAAKAEPLPKKDAEQLMYFPAEKELAACLEANIKEPATLQYLTEKGVISDVAYFLGDQSLTASKVYKGINRVFAESVAVGKCKHSAVSATIVIKDAAHKCGLGAPADLFVPDPFSPMPEIR